MKVSKKIAKKVKQYQKLKSQADKLFEELEAYFIGEQGLEGFEDAFIADKPEGSKQTKDGEYCDQITLGEDWYRGTYYYPIKDSKKYVGCEYQI
ncbi:MAG: hypothetical protein K2N41_04465 [Lachnospiraceae bacterium]|nr:hypothetical protein [Lachnospiraceae bacterium]MDE7238947.1 hypothetical protein [Lachnospiraceae bacterium]